MNFIFYRLLTCSDTFCIFGFEFDTHQSERSITMSTRATYQFISERKGAHTAYIPHAGHPQGAARYLNGRTFSPIKEDPITSIATFMRANDEAEMTSSHEAHGNAAYRYTIKVDDIDGSQLTAQRRTRWARLDDTFETFWQGSVDDFIREYADVSFLVNEYAPL